MDPNELEPKDDAPAAEQPSEEPVAEAPKEEAKEEAPKKDPSERTVPHGALHEERERRKAADRENQALRQQQAVMADRYQQLMAAIQQSQQPQIPSKDVDPLANIDGRLAQAEQQAQQFQRELHEGRQREAAQRQQQAFGAYVAAQEAAFAKETPDYKDALEFAKESRIKELEAAGYAPNQVAFIVNRDAAAIAWDAIQMGKNPAEAIYAIAQSRGYTKKAPAQEKVATLQKGTQAAKTLGNGTGPAGLPTMEQVANMDEDEFARLKADLSKKGIKLTEVVK